MNTQITIRQVALALNINPKSFMVLNEMETLLDTQYEMNRFLKHTLGYDCKQPRDRREVGNTLNDLRMQKMKEYSLSLSEFLHWYEIDPVLALSHLLVEKVSKIHITRIEEYQVTPDEIYEMHINNPDMFLFGLLHLM